MDRCRIGLILVVLLAVGCGVGMSEIHRAKSLNVKPRPHHHSQYQYPSPRDAILSVCQSIWRFTFCVLRCLEQRPDLHEHLAQLLIHTINITILDSQS